MSIHMPDTPLAPPKSPGAAPPLTVAWVVQGDEPYGVRRAVLTLLAAVGRWGWRTPVFSLADGPFADECLGLGHEVRRLGVGRAPVLGRGPAGKAVGFVRLARHRRGASGAIAAALRDVRADAVHVLWPNLLGAVADAARAAGVPGVWEMPNAVGGGYPFGANRLLLHRQAARGRIVPLANSRYTAATLGPGRATGGGVPEVMHLGVDEQQFDPARVVPVTRASLGIPPDAAVLGVIARIGPGKGQDRLLRAVTMVSSDPAGPTDRPPVHLVLLGGPPEGAFSDGLRRTARDAGMGGRLHLVGVVSDPERYYGEIIDVAVNCRVEAEPFGLSVVEAMIMGRPALVHALGGPAETVIDGATGWHVPDPSVEAFAAGVRRALADRPRWPAMGDVARRHALAHYTADRQAAQYAGVLRRILNSPAGAS